MASVSTYLDLYTYRELFGSLFRRDLRAKYKGSALGLLWSLAHPLTLMLVYLLVFSVMLKIQAADYEHYWLFLLAGLPVWVFFATSLQAASRSLLENANLIRKVRFPRQLVPLSIVATQLVSFVVMLAIVIGLSLAYVPEARDTVWLSIPLAALATCLVAGVALVVASLNALYRDVEHLIAALLLPWFFLTPILYSLDDVPGVRDHPRLVDAVHYANFVTPAVEAVRDPIFFGELPAAGDAIYLAISAVLALALGSWVFTRVDDRVAVEV
jgi:lipopolysaccharide transport system permease protein